MYNSTLKHRPTSDPSIFPRVYYFVLSEINDYTSVVEKYSTYVDEDYNLKDDIDQHAFNHVIR